MFGIVADFLEEGARRGHDLVHQKLVGAIEFQQRRQFGADLLADHGHGLGLRQRLVHRAQDIVEQPLMAAFLDEGAQRSGGERREIDRHQLRGDAAADERHQPGILRRSYRFGQQPQRKAREILAALAVAQPVGDERAEIDLPQLGLDRSGFEEMHLDEFAELVGDAVLVALDNGRVRDRQSQRPFEQRHHGVPVGEAADGGGLGKGCDEAEHRMHRQQRLRAEENRKRRRQHRRRQQFHAPQLGGARGVAGGIDDESGGKAHDGFRRRFAHARSAHCRHSRSAAKQSDLTANGKHGLRSSLRSPQ